MASREGACTRDEAEAAFGEVLQRLRDLGPRIHQWAMPLEHLILRLEELAVGRWPPPTENRPGVAQHAAVVDSLVVVSRGRGRGRSVQGRCLTGRDSGVVFVTPMLVNMLQQCCGLLAATPALHSHTGWTCAKAPFGAQSCTPMHCSAARCMKLPACRQASVVLSTIQAHPQPSLSPSTLLQQACSPCLQACEGLWPGWDLQEYSPTPRPSVL